MKKFYVIILSFVCLISQAQNYNCFNRNIVNYYSDNSESSQSNFAVRIDSVSVSNDSTELFGFNMIRATDYNLYNKKGAAWFGKKIIEYPNSMNVIINRDSDSIYIKTNALLNEEWTLYTFSNGNYITAKITEINNTAFLGISDSVKNITLQVKTSAGNNISHNLNSLSIYLSKNYGFIRIFNFYDFPFETQSPDEFLYTIPEQMDIIGISNPQVGWQNITAYDIYNYDVNDEYHTFDYIDNAPHPDPVFAENKEINKILSKTINDSTSINYLTERCVWSWSQYYLQPANVSTYHDTINDLINIYNNSLNVLPLETYLSSENFFSYYFKKDTIIKTSIFAFSTIGYDSLHLLIDYSNITTYYAGYGSLNWWEAINGDQGIEELVYYKKNGIEWGTPYTCDSLLADTIVGITKIKEIDYIKFSIYPNPAINEVNIEIPNFKPQTPALSVVEVSNFKFFSIDGKKLLEGKLESPKTHISTKELESGVYFVEVNVEGEKVNSKLVITK